MPNTRSMPLSLVRVACCLPLLLAACSGKSPEGSQVVATVNKSEISVHQVNQVLQRQAGLQPQQAEAAGRQALERLIEQEVAVQKALDMKLDRDPAVMQSIAAARREVLARAYGAKVADTAARPEPVDLQAYYDARPALFAQRKVYALQEYAVQADPAQTEALGRFVASAKSLQDVTDHLRQQKLAVRASQSTQPAENLPPALVERLNAMKDGQLLLLGAPGGARLVVLAASRPSPVTLEQARPTIEQAVLNERRAQVVQANLEAARKASDVRYFGSFAEVASATGTKPAATRASSPGDRPPAAPAAAVAASAAANAAAATAANAATATTAAEDAAMVSKGLAGLK